jgi:glycyl-tRNA synthetase beta chain
VSNVETREPAAIVEGNERVLRAHSADARFFFDQDRKTPLEARVPKLASIVYHNKLGTQLERVARVERLAGAFASFTAADRGASRSRSAPREGRSHDRNGRRVSRAPGVDGSLLRDARRRARPRSPPRSSSTYWPRYAGDELPKGPSRRLWRSPTSSRPSPGCSASARSPTGDKDPFGLRRHAIGVIRILVEKGAADRLAGADRRGVRAFADRAAVTDARVELASFIYERLRAYLREAGYSANEAEAVLSQRPSRIDLVPAQAAAVRAFSELPEADTLAGANKRIINILRKSASEAAQVVDRGRLTEGAEHDLYLMFQKLEPIVDDRCARATSRGRFSRSRRRSRPSTSSSTTCWSWPTTRPFARTASHCFAASRRR